MAWAFAPEPDASISLRYGHFEIEIDDDGPPLTLGAGVVDDGVVTALTADRLRGVLAPKADAAQHLHDLTAHLELSAFVLFSSVAGVSGAAGQAASGA